MFAGFEVARFFLSSPDREGRAMNVGAANPDAAPTRARCANVVVHFPAWTEPVTFIRRSHGVDHFSTHDVTKLRQAKERFERSHFAPELRGGLGSSSLDFVPAPSSLFVNALFIPRTVG